MTASGADVRLLNVLGRAGDVDSWWTKRRTSSSLWVLRGLEGRYLTICPSIGVSVSLSVCSDVEELKTCPSVSFWLSLPVY